MISPGSNLLKYLSFFLLFSSSIYAGDIQADVVSDQLVQEIDQAVAQSSHEQSIDPVSSKASLPTNELQSDRHEESTYDQQEIDLDFEDEQPKSVDELIGRKINKIIVEGNKHVPLEPIMNSIPYQIGEQFTKQKTNRLIRNIFALGYFKPMIQVYVEPVDYDQVNIVIAVQEKPLLQEVIYRGNKHLSEKDIEKAIDFSKIRAIDEDDLPRFIQSIKKLYRDKDYHDIDISAELKGDGNKVTLILTFNEGRRTLIKRVCFTGNNYFRAKTLRSMIFTRENWVLGFLDRAGSYQPDAIEADKHVLENYYQSHGFLYAKVEDVTVYIEPATQAATITFHVNEGDQYTISNIRVPGNEDISEDKLLAAIPIKVGDLYSKEKIRETIEMLRTIWGNYGYINADIEPGILPDDEHKTVSLTFNTEIGSPVYLNCINIIGNEKTHDKVIRRQIILEEGCKLTTQAMDESKTRVESLGYFDQRDGVNWRMHRIDDDKVDLDLIVKEVKTGRAEAQLGFGGSVKDISSPTESFSVGGSISDTNFLGRGLQINSSVSFSKEERNFLINLTDPWLFDKPIYSSTDLYLKRSLYDEFTFIKQNEIKERITGGTTALGFVSRKFWDSTLTGRVGVEGITYNETPIVKTMAGLTPEEQKSLQIIFDRRFASGAFLWFGGYAFKDVRNHPVHPSRGYQWAGEARVSIHSNLKDNPKDSPNLIRALGKDDLRVRFGFAKFDFDVSWYTPIIGERDLVLCLHGHFGVVQPFKNRSVPFRELYHVGGPASVRGFLYGEIGPMFVSQGQSDMLGAKKAFWLNAELIFPITGDFSMKGAVFYDGGAGWDTPDSNVIASKNLKNNSFSFRHAVGIGVRVLRPTPVKIDWGFKLDKKKGEAEHEVHFSMYSEF
jgi:outer membrane protein insertion porin family